MLIGNIEYATILLCSITREEKWKSLYL
jgi:hypothetical protein